MYHIFSNVLSPDEIDTNPEWAMKNVTEFTCEPVQAILKPKTADKVQGIVRCANENNIPLYPFSSGKNWGQGSKLPVKAPAVLVDLSLLKKITINHQHEFAIIEAGVTQQELSDYLISHNIPLKFPVTGSGKATSVTGNMLERGASAFFHRRTRLLGVEAILANGQIVRTGHWHNHQQKDEPLFYTPGLGPDLTQAFCQSNFGIITSIAIKLLPTDTGTLLFAETTEEKLSQVIDQLSELKKQQLLGEGILVTNKNDPRTTQQQSYHYSGRWSLITSFSGIEEIREVIKKKVNTVLSHDCDQLSFIDTDTTHDLDHPYQIILRDMYQGIPSDYSLQTMGSLNNLAIKNDEEVDQNKRFPGLSVILTAVAIHGNQVMLAIQVARQISKAMDLQCFYNFATLDDYTFEGFFRVYFNRNDLNAVEKAQKWNQRTLLALEKAGIYPYRLNVQQMGIIHQKTNDPFWQTVGKMKHAVDPKNIIAAGRYGIKAD